MLLLQGAVCTSFRQLAAKLDDGPRICRAHDLQRLLHFIRIPTRDLLQQSDDFRVMRAVPERLRFGSVCEVQEIGIGDGAAFSVELRPYITSSCRGAIPSWTHSVVSSGIASVRQRPAWQQITPTFDNRRRRLCRSFPVLGIICRRKDSMRMIYKSFFMENTDSRL